MARSRNHKYIYHYNGGIEELYNLEADPGETRNLWTEDAADAARIAGPLRQAVLEWEKKWGERFSLAELGISTKTSSVAANTVATDELSLEERFARLKTGRGKETRSKKRKGTKRRGTKQRQQGIKRRRTKSRR
jgi:hypothetical protein